MNEQRKRAYRYLLYEAMVSTRPIGWIGNGRRERMNVFGWWSSSEQVRVAGAIADWLHNLAFFSAYDFERFDEDWFWRQYDSLRQRYPRARLDAFRTSFDQQVSGEK